MTPLLLLFLLYFFRIVSGARLPRKSLQSQQESPLTLNVGGTDFDLLKSYVCSSNTNGLDGGHLSKRLEVSPDQLENLFTLLSAMLAEVSGLIGVEANDSASACLLPTLSSKPPSPVITHPSIHTIPPSCPPNGYRLPEGCPYPIGCPKPPAVPVPCIPPPPISFHPPTPTDLHTTNALPPVINPCSISGCNPIPNYCPIPCPGIGPVPVLPSILPVPAGHATETLPRLGAPAPSPFHPSFGDPFRPLPTVSKHTTPTGYLNRTQWANASSTYLLGSVAAQGTAKSTTASKKPLPASVIVPVVPQQATIPPPGNRPIPSSRLPPAPGTKIVTVVPFLPAPTPAPSHKPSVSPPRPVPSHSPPGSNYVFDPQASTNIAVYYGQTPATAQTSLAQQCADSNVDIVNLAFLTNKMAQGSQYPSINFGAACGGQTAVMEAEAPGLLSCPDLAHDISTCQASGKKVLLSIGGATGGVSFTSQNDAENFGHTLWNLFGDPTTSTIDPDLRPFGNVSIDGFDIDNENNQPQYYTNLATTLRSLYASSPQTHYLTSAPQCPFPDASNPMDLLTQCDFVFVQFYNNPPCEIGSAGFLPSLQQWSKALSTSNARIYVGAPSFSAAGSSAYSKIISGPGQAAGVAGFTSIAAQAKNAGISNLGGIMFWDGPEGEANFGGGGSGGTNVIAAAKAGLMG